MSKDLKNVINLFQSKPYLVEMGAATVAKRYNLDIQDILEARKTIRNNKKQFGTTYHPDEVKFNPIEDSRLYIPNVKTWKDMRIPINSKAGILGRIKPNENVLVIFDLHAPFIREGYLEHCIKIYNKYNCNKVVFSGDIIDNHFSSFHTTDADGHSAGEELRLAKLQIKQWHDTFPNAYVCLGNHDRLPDRQRFNAGISKHWIKSVKEVLETPTWTYADHFIFNDVVYCHGEGRGMEARLQQDLMSVVQGHYHSKSSIQFMVGRKYKIFGMQGGCGVDDKSYAMEYGKHFAKMHINCGVVLNNGTLPILEYMEL